LNAAITTQFICKGYSRLLLPNMKANMASSCVACPTSKGNVESFVATVLGEGSGEVDEEAGVTADSQPADIVVLDQNLDLIDEVGLSHQFSCHAQSMLPTPMFSNGL
jgi:hypothetical protein